MDEKHKILKKYWGYDTFRPLQEEIIDSVKQGSDTLALLPTGGGKSLCYQLPALLREGICLVVSPLIALMKDQVQQLNDRHLKAACMVSGMSQSELSGVLNNAFCGTIKFLYVSPERLKQRQFIEYFRRMKVGLIAVDEAHCISQWGFDFRPPYLEIAAIRAYHPQTPLIALTATATPAVADDICTLLQMRHCRRFQSSFVRSNLAYRVIESADKKRNLLHVIGSSGDSGIVYTRSRRNTQAVAHFLVENGIPATYYHAGLDARERDARQGLWMTGQRQVMVATNAFGMGVDKADVRFVVHLDLPDSLEAYFQEAGRAGRDGLSAQAVLIVDSSDLVMRRHDLESDYPPLKYVRNVYRALCNYYRLPLGSGADTRFDFEFERVRATYNFDRREFYGACRFLEREGLVAFPDPDSAHSTLHVPVSRSELYRFQVEHQRLGELLETLMRMYPGLLTAPVSIDEAKVASRCFSTAGEVRGMLARLHERHVVDYQPRTDKPQLIFLSPRIDEGFIFPRQHSYDQLRQAAEQRLEAVIRYATQRDLCRSRYLVAYFGEKADCNCGLCDVCTHRHFTADDQRQAILTQLASSPMTVQGLMMLLADQGYTDITAVLRDMLDRGEIVLDRNQMLSVSR